MECGGSAAAFQCAEARARYSPAMTAEFLARLTPETLQPLRSLTSEERDEVRRELVRMLAAGELAPATAFAALP